MPFLKEIKHQVNEFRNDIKEMFRESIESKIMLTGTVITVGSIAFEVVTMAATSIMSGPNASYYALRSNFVLNDMFKGGIITMFTGVATVTAGGIVQVLRDKN
ncbi:MAG: hypothetical protein ABSD68_01470 [Candidatus Micrarchaeales archaeon]|jgi:hypothetical protein